MCVEELKERLFTLNKIIALPLKETEYEDNHTLQNIKFKETEPYEQMLHETFSILFTHLDYINLIFTSLEKPIKAV